MSQQPPRCPNDCGPLRLAGQDVGLAQICETCGGHLVGLARLRALLRGELVDDLIREARVAGAGADCPTCGAPMLGSEGARICLPCGHTWLTADVMEALMAEPRPKEPVALDYALDRDLRAREGMTRYFRRSAWRPPPPVRLGGRDFSVFWERLAGVWVAVWILFVVVAFVVLLMSPDRWSSTCYRHCVSTGFPSSELVDEDSGYACVCSDPSDPSRTSSTDLRTVRELR